MSLVSLVFSGYYHVEINSISMDLGLDPISAKMFNIMVIWLLVKKMNRKKKINNALKSKLKKANAKLQKSNKPRYISKAERAAMELAENSEIE